MSAAFQEHLETGVTTVCRAWAITRRDGVTLGFTDHDRVLEFDGVVFEADSGMTARAVEKTTGLSVDNTEALGALRSPSITEKDVRAGLYDAAEVTAWQVNWSAVAERRVLFRGTLGELERTDGAFRAELRGLAEALNQPQGLVYQRPCSAVLGDQRCGVDLSGFQQDGTVVAVEDGVMLSVAVPVVEEGWYEKGSVEFLDGAAVGVMALVRQDRGTATRRLVLWESVEGVSVGDAVRLTAGCDKLAATCEAKFSNLLNFRGFPDIPGEDWMMSYPVRAGRNDGGSLRS